MISNIITAAAFLASAPVANAMGNAIVRNGCEYDVELSNVPAQGGGFDSETVTLGANESYSDEYKVLSNQGGWSIKLSKDGNWQTDVLQFEYTVHGDDTLWYDLSQVDGNPWWGNWELVSSDSGCQPRQQAYRYSTDDNYGMQHGCDDNVDITVLLCSGEEQNDDIVASISASAAAAETGTGVYAPAPAPTQGGSDDSSSDDDSYRASTTTDGGILGGWGRNKAAAHPTTLATKASNAAATVTETVYKTIYARDEPTPVHRHARHI